MTDESYKAENSDEIVWLRLNRLKSTRLCENLIKAKLEKKPNPLFSEAVLKSKAVGLSSAIESAIGYWQVQPQALNAKILSRYYFLLQMTIAEQVSSTRNTEDLKEIQKHTENGHGLGTIVGPGDTFPDNYYIFPLIGGHFYSYAKAIGIEVKNIALEKRPRKFSEITAHEKLVSLTDIFRRIPELNSVIEEYLDKPPLSFHIGYSQMNNLHELEAAKEHMNKTGQFVLKAPITSNEKISFISVYSDSAKITPEYLESLSLPIIEFERHKDIGFNDSHIVGKLTHPSDLMWHQYLKTYSSSYATTTCAIPLWANEYDSIVTNFAALYGLSIIVRYMPDLWYRITSGDLNHIGSLIEYYVSVIDHILPLQMLGRITGSKIAIHNPGSFFGPM